MKVLYYDKTQHSKFRAKPPFSSYKTTLKENLNGENCDVGYLLLVEPFYCFGV